MPIILHNVTPPINRVEATIEMLEAIGRNAWLYHASPEGLLQALIQAHASDGLKQAVRTGNTSQLNNELGNAVPKHQINQTATTTDTTISTIGIGVGSGN